MKVQMFYLEYRDHVTNSDKFYRVFVTPVGVLLNYGRHGSDGQEKWHPTDSLEAAEVFANKKVYEKRDKGYQSTEPTEFELDGHDRADSLSRYTLMNALSQARSTGAIRKVSHDLASKAEEFSTKVVELIAVTRKGEVDADGIMLQLGGLERDLERAESALQDARMGLQLARQGLGQKVTR